MAYPVEGPVPVPGPGPGDWVWPWWLQRQIDPASPAWLPSDLVGYNRTGRNWTVIGIPDGADRWIVDRRGLLAPAAGGWALDWWIGAEDRWRLPSREASVRQHLVAGAPVLETVMRVPGGEVVARHWATPGDDADAVVLEIDNTSAGAVAVALALRPVGPAGPTGSHRVALEGSRLSVDGTTVLRADLSPRQSVLSTAEGGDVALIVLANATPARRDAEVVCASGWAGAALVWPLAHRAALRVEIPGAPRGQRRGPAPLRAGQAPARPGPVDTAQGWAARTTRRTRLELPPGPLTEALEAQRRHLLLAFPAGDGTERKRSDEAQIVAALSTAGLRDEAGRHLDAWLDGQHRNGALGPDDESTASTLWALEVWGRTGDDDGLLGRSPIALARAADRVARAAPPLDSVVATWAVAGLLAAARLLGRLGETTAAAQADRWGRARRDTLLTSLAAAGSDVAGATPQGSVAAAGSAVAGTVSEGALLAVVLGVLPARHPVARSARLGARRAVAGLPAGALGGSSPHLGLRPSLSLRLAAATALAGEYPVDAIRWILSVASSTWTWPTVVAPRVGTGSHGSGHDPVVAAALWTCGRSILVADPVPGDPSDRPRLDLLPALPPDWIGQGIEVHGLATSAGSLSYAVRWHGDRPALLWEIDGAGPTPDLSAGGLDPAWRGAGRRGEALLGVVEARDALELEAHADQGVDGPSLA